VAKGPGGIISGGFDPLNAPDAPTNITTSADINSVSLSFDAPVDTGAGTITSYVATVLDSGGNAATNTGSSSPIEVSISGGSGNTARIQAVSEYGPGQVSEYTDSFDVFSSQNIYGFGYLQDGVLGDGTAGNNFSSPVQVGGDNNWSFVASENSRAIFAIKTDGTLWAWGKNNNGRLGLNDAIDRSSPVQVGAETGWTFAFTDANCSFGVRDGKLFFIGGFSDDGDSGTGVRDGTFSSPIQIGALTNWQKVQHSNTHRWACALKTDGTLWTWGNGTTYYATGQGSTADRSSPVNIGSGVTWIDFSVSHTAGMAVSDANELYGWGSRDYGALADNVTSGTRTTPTKTTYGAAGTESWLSLHAHYQGQHGITTDGKLYGWGRGNDGVIGDGFQASRSGAVQIGALTNWSSVSSDTASASIQSCVALKTDGTLWAWGSNEFYGQIGQGSLDETSYNSPVQVGSETNWGQVDGNRVNQMALFKVV
jgi:alpha-tubulin suppressor-like RCC1 family protein